MSLIGQTVLMGNRDKNGMIVQMIQINQGGQMELLSQMGFIVHIS